MKNRIKYKETNILDISLKNKLLEKRNTKLVQPETPYPIFDLTKCDLGTLDLVDPLKIKDYSDPSNYIFAPYIPMQYIPFQQIGVVENSIVTKPNYISNIWSTCTSNTTRYV